MRQALTLVSEALRRALPELISLADAKGWTRTVERDLQKAVESASGMASRSLTLRSWPQVGPVDLAFPGDVAVELKWAKGGDTLGNCAWDVAKLASALVEREAKGAILVAGAPASHWR